MRRTFIPMMLLIAFLSAPTRVSHSNEPVPPPNYPGGDVAPPGTITKKPASVLWLGNFVVHLEITPLATVRETTKVGVVQHQGDTSESISWLCYTMLGGGDKQRIWIASGVMGGNKIVNTVIAEQIFNDLRDNEYCPLLPKTFSPIKLDYEIWLGTNITDLEKILGKPSDIRGDVRIYIYDGKTKVKYKDPYDNTVRIVDFDEISSLAARIRDGKIISIWASKVTSN